MPETAHPAGVFLTGSRCGVTPDVPSWSRDSPEHSPMPRFDERTRASRWRIQFHWWDVLFSHSSCRSVDQNLFSVGSPEAGLCGLGAVPMLPGPTMPMA